MTNGEKAANRFLELLESEKIKKHTFPDASVDYTATQETTDVERYKYFLNSFAYDDLKAVSPMSYYGY